MKRRIRRKKAGGATVVELLMVLAILGLLALTQLQGGLETVSRTKQVLVRSGALSPVQNRAEFRPVEMSRGGEKLPERMTKSVARGLRRTAEWLESEEFPQNQQRPICVGRACG